MQTVLEDLVNPDIAYGLLQSPPSVVSFQTSTGKILWTYKPSQGIYQNFIVNSKSVFFFTATQVISLSNVNGAILWIVDQPPNVGFFLRTAKGVANKNGALVEVIYAYQQGFPVCAYATTTGEVVWKSATLDCQSDMLIAGVKTDHTLTIPGAIVYCLGQVWSLNGDGSIASNVTLRRDEFPVAVYYSPKTTDPATLLTNWDFHGTVCAYDLKTLVNSWCISSNSSEYDYDDIHLPPLLPNAPVGVLTLGTDFFNSTSYNGLMMIDMTTKEPVWTNPNILPHINSTFQSIYDVIFGNDGFLYWPRINYQNSLIVVDSKTGLITDNLIAYNYTSLKLATSNRIAIMADATYNANTTNYSTLLAVYALK